MAFQDFNGNSMIFLDLKKCMVEYNILIFMPQNASQIVCSYKQKCQVKSFSDPVRFDICELKNLGLLPFQKNKIEENELEHSILYSN